MSEIMPGPCPQSSHLTDTACAERTAENWSTDMVMVLIVKLLDSAIMLEKNLGEHSTQFQIQKNNEEKYDLIARWLHKIGTWTLET